MLLKLWKYEWYATRGKLGVLTLATLGMALVAGIDLRMLSRGAYWAMYIPMGQMLDIGLFLFLIASFFSLFVYSFGIRLLLLYRFYKNKFTDQGYLTFTLPVSTQKIFLSSFLNTLMWMANSFVTVGLGIFLFALIGMPANIGYIFESVGIVFQDCLDAFLYGLPAIGTVRMFYPAFSCLSVLVAPVYLTIVPMTAVTVGAVLAKKHKILVAFLLYYGFMVAFVIVNSVITLAPSFYGADRGIGLSASLLLSLGTIVGCYFLNIYLMKYRLNLS